MGLSPSLVVTDASVDSKAADTTTPGFIHYVFVSAAAAADLAPKTQQLADNMLIVRFEQIGPL